MPQVPPRAAAPASPPPPTAAPLRGLLVGLAPLFPASLLSGKGFDRILAVATHLPVVAAGYMGFELPLGRPEPTADFCAALYPGGPLADFLVTSGRSARPGSAEAALGAFADHFTARDAPWARATRVALLEYDAAAATPAAGLPGVFLVFHRPVAVAGGGSAARIADVAVRGLPGALGLPALSAARPAVLRVLEAFAGSARVSNAGIFPRRSADGLRLVFVGAGASWIEGALRSLAWRGPADDLRAALADLGRFPSSLGLSLDVDAAGVGPRIGLELFAGRAAGAWAAGSPSDWEPLVERLVGLGLCAPEKAAGLLAWSGRRRVFTAWDVRVACRGVNHVKVSFGREAPSAKAYVGLALLAPAAPDGPPAAAAAPVPQAPGASGPRTSLTDPDSCGSD